VEGGDGLQMEKVAEDIMNKQSRAADKGVSSRLGAGGVLRTPHVKISIQNGQISGSHGEYEDGCLVGCCAA
jgi:hypothetical protein